MKSIFQKVPVLDSGARGSTQTFVQRQIGDVLLTWENEAYLAMKEIGKDQVEIVTPPVSILAEPPVAVVDQVAAQHGTTDLAKAYLDYLYSDEGQPWRPNISIARRRCGNAGRPSTEISKN